jgi:hypothetical protein
MCSGEQLIKGTPKLLCILKLLFWVLLLQYSVEAGHNVPINLRGVVSDEHESDRADWLTWSAHTRQWARIFASSGRSAVPSFKSSS